jgi:phosphopantothenoylcysteine decarboxylase/phosphopantothenate--cysteine ligase
LNLKLIKNPDILKEVANSNKALYTVGFAAETDNILQNATNKLHEKNVDMIIANKVGENLGFNSDFNEVTILTKNGSRKIEYSHKINIAGKIIEEIARIINNP